jgi:Protein of unknown function (DUF1592)/Protein of unknown function (DUF1588)/Protein of unknown function (DUF1595)/Protein of unknown function (DUF1585)/Protein of unknown function (DUF1587)
MSANRSVLVWLVSVAACVGEIGQTGVGTGGPGAGAGPNGGPGGLIDDPARPPPPSSGGMPPPSTCTPGPLAVTPRLVRLTRAQYENSVRDITGLDVRPAQDLPPDTSLLGFNRTLDLEVGDLVERVLNEQAASVAAKVVATPASFQKVVACDPKTGDPCMAAFIADLGRKVFRRPLSDAEKARYAALFKLANGVVEQGDPFTKGVQVTVEAMLQSPLFIYRYESATATAGPVPLGSHELAARLSFVLVNTTPDAALSLAADRGELGDPAVLTTHARRLLDTPAGKATIREFFGQWMQTAEWSKHLDKSATRYPTWKPAFLPTLMRELELYGDAVTFDRKRGLASLLTSTFTFVNKDTAPLYGVAGAFTDALQRVELNPSQRAGLITQVGFLASNADTLTSSPIHRGVFVQRNLLCTTIPPPGQQVPPQPPTTAGKTTREVVTEHTGGDGCRSCHHTLINPVGFGLENFDAVGAWRDQENGKPVDASGSLVGTAKNLAFNGGVEMAKAIAASPESQACYAKQWLRYSFGREEKEGDACAIDALAEALRSDSYTAVDLAIDLVRTRAFMYRTVEGL